jgi:N-acetyl-1-D-myo-inositol-2-amino-2-deoxy-alpha-D-glucopyranoside deacetylase
MSGGDVSDLALLCVHPHPDDESIACGGVLARYADAGRRVGVVTCTGGEEGENLAGIELGDEELVSHRRRELRDALAILGVHEHRYLGYRDSGMVGTPANDHPEAFHRADLYEASARLARVLRETRPDVVVSDDEHGTYGHPDHVKAHRVTERAVAMAADPWWVTDDLAPWQVRKRYVYTVARSRMFAMHQRLLDEGLASPFGERPVEAPDDLELGVPDDDITTTVEVSAVLDRKRAAMAAHRSQIGEDSFFLNLPDAVARDFFGHEHFVLLHGDPGPREDDLFDGLG